VGIVAALFYLGLAWGQPLLYRIAHGLKVVGGIHWGSTSVAAENARAAFPLSGSRFLPCQNLNSPVIPRIM
jgi:hypothetical protein